MLPFLSAVVRGDYSLPKSVKDLAVNEKQKLKELCGDLLETYKVFGAVGNISPNYVNK
jgi:hypothetical protein